MSEPLESLPWQPTQLKRVVKVYATSMDTTEVVTDAGPAYIKVLGNKEGPHALAADWVGTQLAKWFGLPTFEIALLPLDKTDSYPLLNKRHAEPGPAFAARAIKGHPWDNTEVELQKLLNPETITRLVVFDNWVLNCDRHPPDLTLRKPNYANVFLAEAPEAGRLRILATDHTHCFTCGREWTPRMADIRHIMDARMYGMFPAFARFLRRAEAAASVARLKAITREILDPILHSIPTRWEVSAAARDALGELLYRRAAFVADSIERKLPFGEAG